jgi:hypothetical protein
MYLPTSAPKLPSEEVHCLYESPGFLRAMGDDFGTNPNNVVLSLSADGAQPFVRSSHSMWPLTAQV